jgi:hypothetical protein
MLLVCYKTYWNVKIVVSLKLCRLQICQQILTVPNHQANEITLGSDRKQQQKLAHQARSSTELEIKISCDTQLSMFVSTFMVPNIKHHPMSKVKRWPSPWCMDLMGSRREKVCCNKCNNRQHHI